MNLLSCLHRLPWAGATPQPVATPGGDRGPAPDDTPQGCGWFDSSHELQQGLLVREHSDPAELAAEMPLGAWLDMQLSAWRPVLAS